MRLLLLLLFPAMLHARPIIVQVANQSDINVREFESWANNIIANSPKVPGQKHMRRVKAIERKGFFVDPVPKLTPTSWYVPARKEVRTFSNLLKDNDPRLFPILRRAHVLAMPGIAENGVAFYAGLAFITKFPKGYTNPWSWTHSIAYVSSTNEMGQDRREVSYLAILHEALHTLGARHDETDQCSIMFPQPLFNYSERCPMGLYVDLTAQHIAQTSVVKGIRVFNGRMRQCRADGFSKRRCIELVARADSDYRDNPHGRRRTHRCETAH